MAPEPERLLIDGFEAQALKCCNGGLIIVIELNLKRATTRALVIDLVPDRLQGVTDLVFKSDWFGCS
ncbi:hypothetical protein D3C77_657400 [compost metagenome]